MGACAGVGAGIGVAATRRARVELLYDEPEEPPYPFDIIYFFIYLLLSVTSEPIENISTFVLEVFSNSMSA